MGAFAQALQSLGGLGNDLGTAQQNVKALSQQDKVNDFTNQLNALKLKQLQMALGQPAKDDPSAQFAALEKALGRPLTQNEKLMWLNLAPKAAASQRPVSVGQGDTLVDPATGQPIFTNPAKLTAALKPEKPDTEVFDNLRYQYDPDHKLPGKRDSTGQYVRLGAAKLPKATDDLGGSDLDALARAAAQGRQLPITKEGAALATRLESLNLNAPLKKDVPADVKAFLATPPPVTPTAQDSQRLAAAADRIFGGTTYRQDLMGRGRQGTLMGLRAPYAPQAYSAEEYNAIRGYLADAAQQTGGGGSADDEINQIMNAVGGGGETLMPQSAIADSTLDRFIALPDDQKRAALGKMSPEIRQMLLTGIRTRQAAPTPAAAPGPVKRLLTQTAGVPEDVDTSAATAKSDLSSLNNLSTWGAALKQFMSSLNPVSGMRDATSTAISRFNQPGVGNKIQGAGEYLESGFPYAGPAAVRSAEQTSSGDIAGGIGSAVNAAMLSRVAPDIATRAATGPIRQVGQFLTGVGADSIEKLSREHAEAMSKARADYDDTIRQTRQQNEANDVANVSEHRDKLRKIAADDAQAAATYRAKVSQLTSEFNAGRQALARSSSIAAQLSSVLPTLRERARVAAKAAYPKIAGTVDATDIHADLQSALDARLKGTNRAPASIARIMSETAAPADLLDQASIFRGQGALGRSARGVGIADAGLRPEQLAKIVSEMDPATRRIYESSARSGVNATGKPVDFDTLHGYYSELGRELSRRDLPGDEAAALGDARARLLNQMNTMASAAGQGPEFESAQRGWHQLENTFYNTSPVSGGGGPLARALATADPVTKQLRPDYVRAILADPKAFATAEEHLARYRNLGAPVDLLDAMKKAVDEAKAAPKKLTLPKAPTPTEVPKQPATEFKLPPAEPSPTRFDPVAARRAILRGQTPTATTPGLFMRYTLLRNLIRKMTNVPAVQDYLSQNPR